MNFRGVWALTAALGLTHAPGHAESLPQLIDGVLASHPSMRAQAALGTSAREAAEAARWQFFPTPSIGFEQVDAGSSDPNYPSYGDKNVTTLRLQQPLWTGGRLSAGMDKAEAGLLASRATQEAVRQDLALRVVQVYADWYGAQLKRQAYEKSLQTHQTLRQQINRRIAGGVSPQSDLTLLLGREQQTEADLAAARALEQSALGRLGQLLGRALQAQALATAVAAPLALDASAQELQAQALAQNPTVQKLLAQARIAGAEVSERASDLKPDVYLRVERQYGSFSAPNTAVQNRVFVGLSSHFGAGLSSLSQVGGAQARYQAALADVDSSRINLGEQITADYTQAQAGQSRLLALQASLQSADGITRAWNRQFVAGRKTWLDVMNAAREAVQLEAQIADARASQLLLSWRLAITGHGLDGALGEGLAQVDAPASVTAGPLDLLGDDGSEIPLYAQAGEEPIALRLEWEIDPARLGVGLSDNRSTDTEKEVHW
jgi:adhesin transport system outer membrane protein